MEFEDIKTYNDKYKISSLGEIIDINYRTVKDRLRRGWTIDKAVINVPSVYRNEVMSNGV